MPHTTMPEHLLEFGDLRIDLQRREVSIEQTPLSLTKSEFGVLDVLLGRLGRAFSREEIVSQSKGRNYPVTARSIDVQIVGLRRKLGRLAGHIQTVRGVGYRFVETAEDAGDVAGPTDELSAEPSD